MIVKVGDILKTIAVMRTMFNVRIVRSISLCVKIYLYEKEVVPTLVFVRESWSMRLDERHKRDVIKMMCLRSCAVCSGGKDRGIRNGG